jgi:hypothetical protein
MAALGHCECGHTVRGDSRGVVVQALRSHVINRHEGAHLQLVPTEREPVPARAEQARTAR